MQSLSISNCDFWNNISATNAGSGAIYLTNIGASIVGCRFHDFSGTQHNTILSQQQTASVRGYINIGNCSILNCKVGVQAYGSEILRINNNTFECPLSTHATGVELNQSTGFNVTGNTFNNYGNQSQGVGFSSKAILVTGSSDMASFINNNTFNNCANGVRIIDDNRGLQLRCNEFKAPSLTSCLDFTSFVVSTSIPSNKQGLSDQGSFISTDNLGIYLAGNLFTQLCLNTTPSTCDFSIYSPHPVINYYHHYSGSITNLTKPKYYDPNYLVPQSGTQSIEYRANACASNYNLSGLLSRISDATNISNALISSINIDSVKKQVDYLANFIANENSSALKLVLDEANDSLTYSYLRSGSTMQSLFWLAELYMDDGYYDSTINILNQINILDVESYYYKTNNSCKELLIILLQEIILAISHQLIFRFLLHFQIHIHRLPLEHQCY